jgi:phage FluMu gp28-like protein
MESNNVDIKLYQPTAPQLDLLDIIHNVKPVITLANFGRQTGKTYCSMIDALYQGMNGKQQKILFISPTYDNNRRIMTDIDTLFEDHKQMKELIFESIRYKEQEYVFKNTGSVLSLRSSEQGDTLRGRKAHKIYIDEAAFINESTVVEILLPMITRTNGSMVITSTPNGRNWFYEWFLKGQESHNDFDASKLVSIQRDYRDLGDEEVEKIIDVFKDIMTSDQFNREVLAQFITDDTLFSNVDNCITSEVIEIEDGDELFIGVDIGVSNDFTVITVMNQKYEVIEIDNFNMREDKLTHQEFKDRMMAMYYKYFKYLVAMYIEKNNQELLIEELEDNYKDSYKIYPLGMQTETKGVVISNLRFLFDKMRISIPDNSILINELYGYKAKRSALSGRLQYSNKGVDHDDHVMSLAIAAYAVLEETGSGIVTTY